MYSCSQAQTTRNTTWYTIDEISDPDYDTNTIKVQRLTPFMQYKLRLIANNVVGSSAPSEPTKQFQTIQAPPSHPPRNVTVRAMSATDLRVRWIVSWLIVRKQTVENEPENDSKFIRLLRICLILRFSRKAYHLK